MLDIKPEGPGGHGTRPPDVFDAPPPARLGVGLAGLADRAADFVVFTHAALFTHAGLPPFQDPVQEYVNLAPDGVSVAVADLAAPVWGGLYGPPGLEVWARRLLAVRRDQWPGLARHLAGVVVTDTPRRVLYRTVWFQVTLPGPDAARLPPVEVLGLDGNTRQVLVHRPAGRPPTFVTRPPARQTVLYARRLFAGAPRAEDPPALAAEFTRLAAGQEAP